MLLVTYYVVRHNQQGSIKYSTLITLRGFSPAISGKLPVYHLYATFTIIRECELHVIHLI